MAVFRDRLILEKYSNVKQVVKETPPDAPIFMVGRCLSLLGSRRHVKGTEFYISNTDSLYIYDGAQWVLQIQNFYSKNDYRRASHLVGQRTVFMPVDTIESVSLNPEYTLEEVNLIEAEIAHQDAGISLASVWVLMIFLLSYMGYSGILPDKRSVVLFGGLVIIIFISLIITSEIVKNLEKEFNNKIMKI